MRLIRQTFFLVLTLFCYEAYSQQDLDFHLNGHLLKGKTILKVKRDFHDPYLWVLATNNEVFRINSLSKEIEDFSPQFSAYASLEFMDIAGRSKDTVFIASKNSNQVIHYKNGSIKIIGSNDGLTNPVNSIGVDHASTYGYGVFHTFDLLIGTTKGTFIYNMNTELKQTMRFTPEADSLNSQIFVSSYKRAMYSGYHNNHYPDTIEFVPILVPSVLKGGAIVSALWKGGNKFGDHINTAHYASLALLYEDNFPLLAYHYWGNDKGIFSTRSEFTSHSQWGHFHALAGINVNKITSISGIRNLLYAGMENLLIGTSKGLFFSNSSSGRLLNDSTLYSYKPLANIPVNDIDVNMVRTSPVCEDGAWVATNNGLYLLKPDYAKYNEGKITQAIEFKDLEYGVTESRLCGTDSVSATVKYQFGNFTVQWYKDGKELSAESKSELIITEAGEYFAFLYDPCSNIKLESNHLKVKQNSAPSFTFNYPDQIKLCQGSPATLKVQGNSSYQYRWYKDAVLTGDTTAEISLNSAGKYKVEISSCPDAWVSSKEVEIDFINLPIPVVSADKNNYCATGPATLSVNVPLNSSYNFNWFFNGIMMPATRDRTEITVTQSGNYSVAVRNSLNCLQTSLAKKITFNLPPILTIEQLTKTSLCDGQTIDLKANYEEGTIKWSTGETGNQISVTQPGVYRATATSATGCSSDAEINIKFLANPALSLKDTALCELIGETITLKAPLGYSKYFWNGLPGGYQYEVNKGGTVSLTIEDENGCRTSQEIKVGIHCNEITMPNTFTPNGDGINDTWRIFGLDNDPTVIIQVYNRFGNTVFSEKGNPSPWNGQHQGKKLPSGSYYYVITAKSGKQRVSGSVTIMY